MRDVVAASGRLITFGETMGLFAASRPGRFGLERNFVLGIGGTESNVAIGAARLDAHVTWFGRLGRDATGNLIEQVLRGERVETIGIRDHGFTGLMVKHERFVGANHVDYHRRGSAGSRLQVEDLPEDSIRSAAVLHCTGITPALSDTARAATLAAVEIARAAGVLVSFDVNYRRKLWAPDEAAPALRQLMESSDIVFAGPDEANLVTGTDPGSGREAAQAMRKLGVPEVIVKDGPRGCVAIVEDRELAVPAMNVPVLDPVGAGDAFVAGYLADRIIGCELSTRLNTAVRMGALAVAVPGDSENLPQRSDLEAPGGDDVTR